MKKLFVGLMILFSLVGNASGAMLDVTNVTAAGLNAIDAGATTMVVCSSEPANYAAVSAATLGSLTLPSQAAAVTVSGNVATVITQDVVMSAGSATTATSVCLTNGSSILYACADTTGSPSVTSGQTWTVPQFTITFAQP